MNTKPVFESAQEDVGEREVAPQKNASPFAKKASPRLKKASGSSMYTRKPK